VEWVLCCDGIDDGKELGSLLFREADALVSALRRRLGEAMRLTLDEREALSNSLLSWIVNVKAVEKLFEPPDLGSRERRPHVRRGSNC
jgi:hypothetical protein